MAAVVLLLGLVVGGLVAARAERYWRPSAVVLAGLGFLAAGVLALPLSRAWAAGFFAPALAVAAYREATRRRVRHASPTHETTTVAATPS